MNKQLRMVLFVVGVGALSVIGAIVVCVFYFSGAYANSDHPKADTTAQAFTDDIHAEGVWQDKPSKDVFFECALIAMANSDAGRRHIQSLIKSDDPHTFKVRFPKQESVTVTDDDIKRLDLSNKEKWASVVEAAFVQNFDVDDLIKQLQQKGQPAIGLALNALTAENSTAFRPDEQGVEETNKILAEIFSKHEPVLVSLKHKQEVKGTPVIKNPVALAITDYDAKTETATLRGCFASELAVDDEGLVQVDQNTYKIPVKLFPKYVRFVAYATAV